MDKRTRDIAALVVVGFFTVTVCALVLWHAFTDSPMDSLEQTLVMVLIALAAALGGIQLPSVLGGTSQGQDKGKRGRGPGEDPATDPATVAVQGRDVAEVTDSTPKRAGGRPGAVQ
jgi:hypothetical protein